MDPFDLPPELLDVECQLAERAHAKPDSSFRRNVLSAMRDKWTTSRASSIRQSVRRGAATLAASVLLSLNVAMSLANHRAWTRAERIDRKAIENTAREMQKQHPDLPEREAYQLAALVRMPPTLPASQNWMLSLSGEESWDMR